MLWDLLWFGFWLAIVLAAGLHFAPPRVKTAALTAVVLLASYAWYHFFRAPGAAKPAQTDTADEFQSPDRDLHRIDLGAPLEASDETVARLQEDAHVHRWRWFDRSVTEATRIVRFATAYHPNTDRGYAAPFPNLFYEGVVYGISTEHALGTAEAHWTATELLEDLRRLTPPADAIFVRNSTTASDRKDGAWSEAGFAVYFRAEHATKEAERALLFVARALGQSAVFKWWPHRWGSDPLEHVTIMQTLVPVASGLSALTSQEPLYLIVPDAIRRFNPNEFLDSRGNRVVKRKPAKQEGDPTPPAEERPL